MKKILILWMMIAVLAACNNDKEVEIEYQLTAKIDVLDVVKDLKDLDNAALFPNGSIPDEDYSSRVRFFVYDDQGDLCFDKTTITKDFSEVVTISTALKKGKYTLIATADLVKASNNKVSFEFWIFNQIKSLDKFTIKDDDYVGWEYKALGICNVELDMESSHTINAKVKPVGSLITFYFSNINSNSISTIYYERSKTSDYYSVVDGNPVAKSGTFYSEYQTKSQYTGYYDQRYYLPMQNMTLSWETSNSSGQLVKSGNTTFNIEQGKNKVIRIDVTTGAVQNSSVKSGFPDSAIESQSIKVKDFGSIKIESEKGKR